MRTKPNVASFGVFLSLRFATVNAFVLPSLKNLLNLNHIPSKAFLPHATSTTKEDPTFVRPDPLNDFSISDPDCISSATLMRRILIPVEETIHPSGEIGISYIHWPASPTASSSPPPSILLVPGFDSSCLEYRRLGPKLSSLGVNVYAVDVLGWGFTQLPSSLSLDYSASAKLTTLASFWKTLTDNAPVCIGGASLGGAVAIEYAADPSSPATSCVLLDAQGFVDGIGPIVSLLPTPLARLGVGVLKSVPLRNYANNLSYFDPEKFATEDALAVGRIHCLREGWEDAMLSFMTTGGFKPKEKVEKVLQRTCILWGRQDNILDGKEFANKFMEVMPNKENELHWVENCGHVPHLEQSEETAKIIYNFLNKNSNK